jgi:hypothetical protein
MTDKIKVAVEGAWRFLHNGKQVLASDDVAGDENLVIQTEAAWALTINSAPVAEGDGSGTSGGDVDPEPGPEPEPEPGGDWPVIDKAFVDRAVGFGPPAYKNTTNSNSNYGAKGTSLFTTIYAYNGGDKRDTVKADINEILANLIDQNKGPCGMNGPGAAQEALALAWFHLYRASDLWAGTDAGKKKKIDAIFHALAAVRAWEGNDSSASHGEWTITGRKDTDFKDIGPNISYSIPSQLVLCAEWFGYPELDQWLNSTTIAKVRTEVKEAFGGTGGKLYKTLNWKHEGVDQQELEAQDYYRCGTSADAPTDDQINASLKNLKYYGAPMSDLAKFMVPNADRGVNKVLNPTKETVGKNEWVGNNQSGLNNGAGTQVDGKKRGYCINKAGETPHVPGVGAMVYEINGVDEGGLRSSMGYAFWTVYVVNCQLIVLAMNDNPVLLDAKVADFIERWGQAKDIIGHFDKNDYNSVAHISNKGGSGGPGPIIWSDDKATWQSDINLFLWEAIVARAQA